MSCPSRFEIASLNPLTLVEDSDSFSDLDLGPLEDELMGPSFEVALSLSVCGNIHRAEYFPF